MSTVDTSKLKALGSGKTEYKFDGPHAHFLECFASPLNQQDGFHGEVAIVAPEFTSLCPLTGQPDFATIRITYQPRKLCVESKALKLYLGSFRAAGEFHEACVQRIANDLVSLLDPNWLSVRGEFTPRGGLPFWPAIEYQRPTTMDSPVGTVARPSSLKE